MSIGSQASQIFCLCSNSMGNRTDKCLVRWYLNSISTSLVDKFGATDLLLRIDKNAFGQQDAD